MICLHQVAEDNTRVSSWRPRATGTSRTSTWQHATLFACFLPPVPVGTTLADHLCTVLPKVVEVATYCIHLGATLVMAAAQLRLGEDLTVVEPGFPREMSYR